MEPWLQRTLIWAVFGAALTALCFWKPRPARAAVGVFFAIMGLGVHGSAILTDPQQYVTFAQGALLPLYRDVAVAVVSVNPTLFGLGMLIFELIVAGLMLSARKYAKAGFATGVLFLLAIMPLGPEEMANVILAVGVGYLFTRNFPRSVAAELVSLLRPRTRRAERSHAAI